MPPHPLTRRQALKLGAAAAALGAVGPVRSAVAAPTAEAFSLDLSTSGAVSADTGWRATRVFTAPRRFDLVGLGWDRASHVEAQVRARRRAGAWTGWAPLHQGAGHGPDVAGSAGVSDPVWTGAADEFQLRLAGRPRGLRAHFVRSGPAARAARSRVPLGRAAAARRQLGAPVIIPRIAWGGDRVIPRSAPGYGSVQLAFVHHTVTANDYGPEDSAAIVLGVARYHRDTRGWNDVGYNFLVDKYGQIFEGRAGGIDLAIVGAQTQGFNSVSTGVACLGDFTSVAQTEAGLDALARLIGWKLSLHGVPVQGVVTVTSAGGATNRFPAGAPVSLERISGHRDGNSTACPGNILYGQLADLRNRAAGYVAAPAAVTVRAASTRLRGTTTASLSGTVRFADGSSPAGARVEILYGAAAAAPPSLVASASCAADGAWSTTTELPRSGAVRARFPGDATRPPLESTPLTITVLPRLSLRVSARRIRRGGRIGVSGVAWPASSDRVGLLLERRVGGRYVRVRRRRLPLRDTRYAGTLAPSRRGLYRLTVAVDGASLREYVRII